MASPEAISQQTLDGVPSRVFKFLMAIVEAPAIAAAMALKSYKQSDHDYALSRLSRMAIVPARSLDPTVDRGVREAVVELDSWDEPNFAAIKASLSRLHLEQAEFVFKDLQPRQGPEAVFAVGTLLDRLDALESSDERLATRAEDHAALATLVERGYTPAERMRLRGLIAKTTTVVAPAPVSHTERVAIQKELYAWLVDWSATARLAITRRDHLIRLGLAKRRQAQPKAQPGGGASGGGAAAPVDGASGTCAPADSASSTKAPSGDV